MEKYCCHPQSPYTVYISVFIFLQNGFWWKSQWNKICVTMLAQKYIVLPSFYLSFPFYLSLSLYHNQFLSIVWIFVKWKQLIKDSLVIPLTLLCVCIISQYKNKSFKYTAFKVFWIDVAPYWKCNNFPMNPSRPSDGRLVCLS